MASNYPSDYCPNEKCRRTTLALELWSLSQVQVPGGAPRWRRDALEHKWSLIPESVARPFPDYVPAAILGDYREACLIATLSPKASATLARRCLQGMIRDFWGIKKRRLKDEIDALEEKVNSETWDAIDSVRKIGNIGAHMEADINLIVDVVPEEAGLLIGLIETLIVEWYVARYERAQRMARIKAAAEGKQNLRQNASDLNIRQPDVP
jgi:uncharacterized protein DUF4145